MHALIYDIVEHLEQQGWANLSDFVLGPPQAVPAQTVIDQPDWSLYGLDKDAGVAVFVELATGTDLAKSPFVYADQQKLARRVLTVPFAALDSLADMVPAAKQVIFIFSIGRCGSTLIADALNAVPNVWSLSEPDAYSTLIMQHYYSKNRLDFPPKQTIGLIRACTRLLYRPPVANPDGIFAVKLKSQSLFQADLFHQALPEATCVFLYRDALSWSNSVYQMMRKYGWPSVQTGDDRASAWTIFAACEDLGKLRPYLDIDADAVPAELALAPAWACNMEEYSKHLHSGVPFLAMRYNEINAERDRSLQRLFEHCRLPVEYVEKALAAFDHDSQAGTKIARDIQVDRLSKTQLERLGKILARYPEFGDPNLLLADIYSGIAAG